MSEIPYEAWQEDEKAKEIERLMAELERLKQENERLKEFENMYNSLNK